MFEHHKKESPILSLAGIGGGPASYIFYSAGAGNEVKEISRSLRFNGEDSSNLPKLARNGTAGNQRTWTFSTWLKRGTTGSREQIFSAAGSHNTYIEFQDDQLMIEDYGGGVNFKVQLKRVFRDPSAWYHIVVVVDTTISSPESDRVKIYVNGKRETEFQGTPTYPSENYDTSVNDTGEHKLGQFPGNTNFPLKGYLADVHLVDGTAVTETNGVVDAFGFFDNYDVWQPKAYSASHGNNGFNLTFSDTSSTAAIGYDSAGSNNYTPTNLVASASAAYAIDLDGNDYIEFPGPGDGISGDFTMEAFFLMDSSSSGYERIFSTNEGSYSDEQTIIRRHSNGNLQFYCGDSSPSDHMGPAITHSVWHHAAMVRSGNTVSYYYDGSRLSTDTNTTSFDVTKLVVGGGIGSEQWTGDIHGARFTLGQALYSGASYTVPTSAITTTSQGAIASNVKVLAGTTSTVNENAGTLGNGTNNGDPTATAANVFGDPTGLDVLGDSPSNLTAESGNNQGNYATLNPLRNNQTLSNGNLAVTGGSSWQRTTSTMSMGSGRFYWEYEITASNEHVIGVGPLDMQLSGNLGAGSPPGSGYGTETGFVNGTGANGSWSNTGGSTTGDHFGIIFDADAGEMYVFKNGAALNNGNYTHSGLTDGPYEAVLSLNGSSRSGVVNFGQRPYRYPLTQSKLVRNYSSNASYPATNLFDGSTTTYTAAAAFSSAFTWNPYLTDVTSLRIFVDIGSRQEQLTVVGNAGSHTTTFSASTNGWQTIDLTNSGTSIDKITFGPRGGGGEYIDVFAIEVNGTIVTDSNTPVSNSAYGSLCSTNISVPVPVSTTGFKALAYDGNGNATREITGMGHSPDFLWITQTNAGGWQHVLYDRTRGPGTSLVTKSLSTNSDRTEASGNDTNHGFVSAFGTDGFTVDKGTQSGGSYTNHLNWNYLAYSWDAGETAVTYGPSGSGADNESSNYDILTTVRANTTTGVSVLSYTGSGNNQDKIAHGLGATPEVWILKSRTGTREWYLYTTTYDGSVDFITINGNAGKSDSQSNNPNATSISLYGSTANSTENYAGYAFRSVEGFSKFGTYTGSGSQQFVPVGFTPAWVMIKRFTDNTVGQWTIYDTANSPANEVTKKLWADAAGGEEDHTNNSIDIVSNGFVLDPGSDSGNVQYTNTGSVGYFYMAFAEHPLTTARAR